MVDGQADGKRYCWNCGNEVSENAIFCPQCGSPLNQKSGQSDRNSQKIHDNQGGQSQGAGGSQDGQVQNSRSSSGGQASGAYDVWGNYGGQSNQNNQSVWGDWGSSGGQDQGAYDAWGSYGGQSNQNSQSGWGDWGSSGGQDQGLYDAWENYGGQSKQNGQSQNTRGGQSQGNSVSQNQSSQGNWDNSDVYAIWENYDRKSSRASQSQDNRGGQKQGNPAGQSRDNRGNLKQDDRSSQGNPAGQSRHVYDPWENHKGQTPDNRGGQSNQDNQTPDNRGSQNRSKHGSSVGRSDQSDRGGHGTSGNANDNKNNNHLSGKVCPKCNSPMGPQDLQCPLCGYDFREGKSSRLPVIAAVVSGMLLLGAGGFLVGSHILRQNMAQSTADAGEQNGGGTAATGVLSGTGDSGSQTPVDDNNIVIYPETDNSTGAGIAAATQTEAPAQTQAAAEAAAAQTQAAAEAAAAQTQAAAEAAAVQTETAAAIEIMTEAQTEDTEMQIHTYQVVMEDCTWEEAFTRCLSLGGYLVRINSLEEFQYITQQITDSGIEKGQFYIGARRDPDSDSYYLVNENNVLTGTRLDNGYTEWLNDIWLTGEPSYRDNTLDLEECYVTMFRYGDEKKWVINDVPNDLIAALSTNQGKVGYICEIER